jgi:peptide/nickel transport system ATP-binding protein
MTPLLSIDSLHVSIGATAVIRGLSLRIAAGEILGLVGASGSGKSMTALSILQLLPAQAVQGGSIHLQGEKLTGLDDRAMQRIRGRDIGMVFQEPMTALNPMLRIGAQVQETVRLHRTASGAAARALAREALDAVGLCGEQGAFDRYPHELSGGQRQRVAIAMAIVLGPKLLIADEPTTALDVGTQAQVLELLSGLARDRGMGLLLVSHDLAVVARVTDRVAVMHGGTIVEEVGTTPTLRNLHHPYSLALRAAAELAPRRSPRRISSDPVLEVSGIVREYGRVRRTLGRARPVLRAVDDASLIIHARETVGLVGESGSGKSSLLRVILALDRPQSGEVRLHGERFSAARGGAPLRLRRSIQGVFQDPYGSFDPRWRVDRVVAEPFFAAGAGWDGAARQRRVATVLEQVGLSVADALRYPQEFSGGQRQRIAIARALVTEPAVIVFDEAVSALDVLVRAQILALLAELSARLQLAYLFVSHDLNVVRAIADRIYVMQRGRIVESGPTAEVFAAPQHAYTRALIAATPQLRES